MNVCSCPKNVGSSDRVSLVNSLSPFLIVKPSILIFALLTCGPSYSQSFPSLFEGKWAVPHKNDNNQVSAHIKFATCGTSGDVCGDIVWLPENSPLKTIGPNRVVLDWPFGKHRVVTQFRSRKNQRLEWEGGGGFFGSKRGRIYNPWEDDILGDALLTYSLKLSSDGSLLTIGLQDCSDPCSSKQVWKRLHD